MLISQEGNVVRSIKSTISVSIETDAETWTSPVEARHLGDTEWRLYDGLTRCYIGDILSIREAFDAVYSHAVAHLPSGYSR